MPISLIETPHAICDRCYAFQAFPYCAYCSAVERLAVVSILEASKTGASAGAAETLAGAAGKGESFVLLPADAAEDSENSSAHLVAILT